MVIGGASHAKPKDDCVDCGVPLLPGPTWAKVP